MSGIQRVDRLSEPPIPGKYYLVPVVTARWHGILSSWPVIGPMHTDAEFFNFKMKHYHIDGRFLSKKQRTSAEGAALCQSMAGEVQAAPLTNYFGDLPSPVISRRRCWVSDLPYEHGEKQPIKDIRSHFAGVPCEHGKGGWVCPHRKASLGSVAVIDGVITCPLHGLRIDAITGLVLPNTLAAA